MEKILTGKCKEDFLNYVYHTMDGFCHIENNTSKEISAISTLKEMHPESVLNHQLHFLKDYSFYKSTAEKTEAIKTANYLYNDKNKSTY